MKIRNRPARFFQQFMCVLLAWVIAITPSANVVAQTFGAQQAVRQRVQGLQGQPAEESVPPIAPVPSETPPSTYLPAAGILDTTHVTPGAAAVIVIRPAQLLSSPLARLLPTEVASAAGLAYLGIDPVTVDEVVAFFDMSSGAGMGYGVTVKFNQPFRAASIPPHARPMVQLADLAGRKYLQSAAPQFPSFYGTNRTTLIAAPDATLRQMVESAGQPKSGPLIDRLRDVPAGADLFVAADVASLRPLIQMAMAQFSAQLPPNMKPVQELPNLISAVQLTLNVSAPGPTSLVLEANDETAAQQIETMLREASAKYQATPESQQAALGDPIAEAMLRYRERMSQPFTPQRNGASITCLRIDGQDPAQQQLAAVAVIGVLVALSIPALQKARDAAEQPPAAELAEEPAATETASPGDPASDRGGR